MTFKVKDGIAIAGSTFVDGSRNVQAGTIDASNATLTGELRGPASFVIDPSAVGDNTGTVIIRGNLQVDGSTTTINSTTLSVDDLNIVLADGAANAAAANGAGLTVAGSNATFTYTSADDRWNLNKNLNVSTVFGALSGNASTASAWATARTLSFTSDATGSMSVDGSGNASAALTLANSGVTAGTYTKVTVDAKGRVTTGTTLASADLPTYTGTISSSQVTTALGFTPYNSTNPSGYITNTGNARVGVENNGTLVGTRRNINFIPGTGISLSISDDSANEEVDVTITSSGLVNYLPLSAGTASMLSGELVRSANGGVDGTYLTILRYGTTSDLQSGTAVANRWVGLDGTVTAGAASGNVLRVRAYSGGTGNAAPVNVVDFRGDRSSNFYGRVIRTTSAGINSPSARFALTTSGQADFHIASSTNGASPTNTQQYGITFSPSGGSTQAGILFSENSGDGTAIGFFSTNSYAAGPLLRASIDPVGNFNTAGAITQNGSQVLTAGNFTSYSPSLTGSGASGTWGINVTGNAGTATTLQTTRAINAVNFNGSSDITIPRIRAIDDRTMAPADGSAGYLTFAFGSWNNNNTADYADILLLRSYTDSSGGADNMIAFRKNGIGMRIWQQTFGSSTAFSSSVDVVTSANVSSYAIAVSGGTLTGAIRAPQITAGGSTNTDANLGVQGTAHITGTTYWGGTVGNVNSWSSLSTSSGGTHTFSGSRFIFDRVGYGSQPLIDLQSGSITLSQPAYASNGITVNDGSANGKGINLYSGSPTSPTYGLFFAQTSNFGTYGAVSADWATYFTMNSTANRGWIFREVNTLGNVASISNQGNVTIRSHFEQGNNLCRPNVNWSATSATGMVYFELPGGSGNYGMVHMVFDIYEYNSNSVSTVIVGGHNWNGAWYNIAANVVGQTDKAVRLAFRGGKYVVCFGTASSSWSYGTVVLRKIHNGGYYDNIIDMVGQFTASITTSESLSWDSGDLRALRTPQTMFARGYRGNSNIDGTGEASWHPAGIYSNGTNWLYGSIITNSNSINAGSGAITCGSLTASGNVTAFSDERLKKDWTPLPDNFIDEVSKIKAGTYIRIDNDERQAGSSAQEWQKLLPEVVDVSDDEQGTLSLAYGNAALISAIELAKRVVKQDEIIFAQDQRIQRLESIINKLIGDKND